MAVVLILLALLANLASLPAQADDPVCGIGIVATGDVPTPKTTPPLPWGEGVVQDHLVVHELIAGAPAGKSGLLAKDEIIQIDDTKVAGMKFKDACNLLRGPAGTSVKVTVKRQGEPAPLSFTITRAVVPISQ